MRALTYAYTRRNQFHVFRPLCNVLFINMYTRAKMNNLINVVNNLLQCCAAPCRQCCAAPCQQLLSTAIVHSCSIIVDSHQQAFFKHFHFSSTIISSCSNNIVATVVLCQHWSNNTHQHCQFHKCCWTLITTLFRRCSANNVALTWSIFARVVVNNLQTQVSNSYFWSMII